MVIPRRRSPFAPINALFIAAPYDCHPSAATGVSIGTVPASGRPARGPYRRLVGARRREIRRPRPPARSRGPPRTRPPTGPPRPAPAAPPGHMPRLGRPATTSEHSSWAAAGPPRSRGWLRGLDPQHRRAHRAREIRTDWPGMHRAFPHGPSLPVRKREPGGVSATPATLVRRNTLSPPTLATPLKHPSNPVSPAHSVNSGWRVTGDAGRGSPRSGHTAPAHSPTRILNRAHDAHPARTAPMGAAPNLWRLTRTSPRRAYHRAPDRTPDPVR